MTLKRHCAKYCRTAGQLLNLLKQRKTLGHSLSAASVSIDELSLLNLFMIRPLRVSPAFSLHAGEQGVQPAATHEGVESKKRILAPRILFNSRSYSPLLAMRLP